MIEFKNDRHYVLVVSWVKNILHALMIYGFISKRLVTPLVGRFLFSSVNLLYY